MLEVLGWTMLGFNWYIVFWTGFSFHSFWEILAAVVVGILATYVFSFALFNEVSQRRGIVRKLEDEELQDFSYKV